MHADNIFEKDFSDACPLGIFIIEPNMEALRSALEGFERFHADKLFCMSQKLRQKHNSKVTFEERASDEIIEQVVLQRAKTHWYLKSVLKRKALPDDLKERIIFSHVRI